MRHSLPRFDFSRWKGLASLQGEVDPFADPDCASAFPPPIGLLLDYGLLQSSVALYVPNIDQGALQAFPVVCLDAGALLQSLSSSRGWKTSWTYPAHPKRLLVYPGGCQQKNVRSVAREEAIPPS